MTPRDKKILLALIPLVLVVGYWFTVLGPKRKEAGQASEQLAKAEGRRDAAVAKLNELRAAKGRFDQDYRTVIQLGKAIPSSLDMPGLIDQLDDAARGTGIEFDKVAAGDSSSAAPAGSGAQGSGGSQAPSSPDGKAAPGGSQAQSGPGRATETAGNKVNEANAQSGAAQQQGGSGAGAPQAGSTSEAPGLESVPLEFSFSGSFFDLADFFHRMKRFVRVANDRLVVRGRLITVDSFMFASGDTFPKLTATVKATVYLVPKDEGVAAGATPAGPSPTSTSSPTQTSPTPAAPPAATASP